MRTLEQALLDHDLIVLRVIAEWLDLDLTGADKAQSVKQLAAALTAVDLAEEIEGLEPEEAEALAALVREGGRAPVAVFSRTHGEVRAMGPGRLEREEPWLDPISPAEALWYRGFLYRGFDQTNEGLLEFYYVPPELLARLQPSSAVTVVRETAAAPTLAPIDPPEGARPPVDDAVDDLTTLLALAQRTGLQSDRLPDLRGLLMNPDRDRRSLLLTLATEMSLLRRVEERLRPTRAAIDWLQHSREAQLRALVDAWSRSVWNELRHTPGLVAEGEGWANDPLLARTALMDVLPADDHWYRVADVVAVIRGQAPDFQRPDGNYDTWYLRDAETREYLSGFEAWERVEGRLLPFLIQGPLYWLGMVELSATTDPALAAYRLAPRALAWLGDEPPPADEVRVPLIVQPEGVLLVPHNASRLDRFRAARIADPEPFVPGRPYRYRIVPSSLAWAREQDIGPEQMLGFLESAGGRPVPASVRRGITRWAERGVEGRLQSVVVLRVGDPAILETLRTNPKTRDFLTESLGELAVVVRAGQWEAFRQAVAALGLLLDVEVGEN
ncbi:MAG: helicase-associated domain-containing protein [Anaerolineae bacterium]|nr:helicase-associated domain-containing protein [Anaerolineae bacterium]